MQVIHFTGNIFFKYINFHVCAYFYVYQNKAKFKLKVIHNHLLENAILLMEYLEENVK